MSSDAILLALLGVALITAGIVLGLRPGITEWIARNYNKKTAQWLSDRGVKRALETFPAEVKIMRVVIPLAFIVIGLGFCLYAASV